MVDYNLEKLVRGEFKLEEGIQRKKELMITEDNICKSTLDIWCRKEEFHPELFQYEVYKCFILRFDLSYSCFFNPEVDMLGLRLGDTLNLKLNSFIRDGDRWRLDIVEQKTKKTRTFTVPVEIYSFIQEYAYDLGIGRSVKLFDISARQVERHLLKVFQKMGLGIKNFSSHSYRKFFAIKVFVENNYNIEIVRVCK